MSVLSADYQEFQFDKDGCIASYGQRMADKLTAIGRLWNPYGKTVLDVGCDFGFWSFLASQNGASEILGLDRNRTVKGLGWVDLIEHNRQVARTYPMHNRIGFQRINIGRQWHEFGEFDTVLLLSLYHHIFQNCGEHEPIWFWLWRHCRETLIWENPVDTTDVVVQHDVERSKQHLYIKESILEAARRYFNVEVLGPAVHSPTREVWICTPHPKDPRAAVGDVIPGAGGATKAFEYLQGRRIKELEAVLGITPYPGSLNIRLDDPFGWDHMYYPAEILDVKDRKKGLESPWHGRRMRFYPVTVTRHPNIVANIPEPHYKAYGMRFEGEHYPEDFLELVSPIRLRDKLSTPTESSFPVEVYR